MHTLVPTSLWPSGRSSGATSAALPRAGRECTQKPGFSKKPGFLITRRPELALVGDGFLNSYEWQASSLPYVCRSRATILPYDLERLN
jgi:hypothetical protein